MAIIEMTHDIPTICDVYCPITQEITGTRRMKGWTIHHCMDCGRIIEADSDHREIG